MDLQEHLELVYHSFKNGIITGDELIWAILHHMLDGDVQDVLMLIDYVPPELKQDLILNIDWLEEGDYIYPFPNRFFSEKERVENADRLSELYNKIFPELRRILIDSK